MAQGQWPGVAGPARDGLATGITVSDRSTVTGRLEMPRGAKRGVAATYPEPSGPPIAPDRAVVPQAASGLLRTVRPPRRAPGARPSLRAPRPV